MRKLTLIFLTVFMFSCECDQEDKNRILKRLPIGSSVTFITNGQQGIIKDYSSCTRRMEVYIININGHNKIVITAKKEISHNLTSSNSICVRAQYKSLSLPTFVIYQTIGVVNSSSSILYP